MSGASRALRVDPEVRAALDAERAETGDRNFFDASRRHLPEAGGYQLSEIQTAYLRIHDAIEVAKAAAPVDHGVISGLETALEILRGLDPDADIGLEMPRPNTCYGPCEGRRQR